MLKKVFVGLLIVTVLGTGVFLWRNWRGPGSDRGKNRPQRPEIAGKADNGTQTPVWPDPELPATDWRGFRGSYANATASDDSKPPIRWSDDNNLKWKVKLPGPGASSPIVVGDRVFVTCYSGYGVERDAGSVDDLKRHLLCVEKDNGKLLWEKTIPSTVEEDPYRGYITEHGYASSTPVSDGKRVFVQFGKTGVLAFDLEGEQLWKTGIGTESNSKRWGSAASPTLYADMLIVNASYESQSLYALDISTGKEIWKTAAEGVDYTYGSPLIAKLLTAISRSF